MSANEGLVLVPAPRPLGEAHTAMPLVIEPDHDPGIQHQGQARRPFDGARQAMGWIL